MLQKSEFICDPDYSFLPQSFALYLSPYHRHNRHHCRHHLELTMICNDMSITDGDVPSVSLLLLWLEVREDWALVHFRMCFTVHKTKTEIRQHM